MRVFTPIDPQLSCKVPKSQCFKGYRLEEWCKMWGFAHLPLGLAGTLTTIVSLVTVPILLCGLTFGLLVAFGMI